LISFLEQLNNVLQENINPKNAITMEAYMKNIAPFYGIKATNRKLLSVPFLQLHKTLTGNEIINLLKQSFTYQHREMHYFGLELAEKGIKKLNSSHLHDLTELVQQKSWWDTVDFIATRLIGRILATDKSNIENLNTIWTNHANLWVNRTSIIFQLKFKEKTNQHILFSNCIKHANSNQFFIQKAIGWALREYAKTHPLEVKNFVESVKLKPLSKREALKNL